MNNTNRSYFEWRKHIYASINATKGNLMKLKKSSLLTKEEKDKLAEVINAMESLRQVYVNTMNKCKNQIELPDGRKVFLQIINVKEIKKIKKDQLIDYLNEKGYFINDNWFPYDGDDLKLYEIYMQGFKDELDNIQIEEDAIRPYPEDMKYAKRAYNIGRIDAYAGDDAPNIDYKSKNEIIALIKRNEHKKNI
jgi:hypothetical protein